MSKEKMLKRILNEQKGMDLGFDLTPTEMEKYKKLNPDEQLSFLKERKLK